MKSKTASSPQLEKNESVKRKGYKAPRLTRYGNLKDLTAAFATSASDGAAKLPAC